MDQMPTLDGIVVVAAAAAAAAGGGGGGVGYCVPETASASASDPPYSSCFPPTLSCFPSWEENQ